MNSEPEGEMPDLLYTWSGSTLVVAYSSSVPADRILKVVNEEILGAERRCIST